MDVFQGIPASPGVAIAAAARLHTEFGISTLAPERLHRLGARLRRFGMDVPETEQIILIADTVPPAYWLAPIPGIEIVGIAAQSEAALTPIPHCPTVVGLGDLLLGMVDEDVIIIVDGDRGKVYIAPDAATVARYQAPTTLARRLFVDTAHLPARTASDNRVISVLATAPTLISVTEAMEQGADGIHIPEANDFLGGEHVTQTSGEQLALLLEIAHTIGGQSIFLSVPPERLALSALSRAAAASPIHLALPEPEQLSELQGRLQEIEESLTDSDALFGTVRFEAWVSATDPEAFLPDSLEGYSGLLTLEPSGSTPLMERLLLIAGLARRARKPAAIALSETHWQQSLGDAIGLGFGRIIVPPALVADVKDAVRTL